MTVQAIDPGLLFTWIPYYKGPGTPWLDRWDQLGFDYVTLQPNFAFNNVTAADRFGVVRELAVNNRQSLPHSAPMPGSRSTCGRCPPASPLPALP